MISQLDTLAQLVPIMQTLGMSDTNTYEEVRLPALLSLRELAAYLGVPPSSVYYWRQHGGGPPGFLIGRQLRFRVADVDRWLQEQAARAGVP